MDYFHNVPVFLYIDLHCEFTLQSSVVRIVTLFDRLMMTKDTLIHTIIRSHVFVSMYVYIYIHRMFSQFDEAAVPTFSHFFFFVLGILFVKTQGKPSTKTNPAGRLNGLNWAGFCVVLRLTVTPNYKPQGCTALSGNDHYRFSGLVRRPHV